jgi:hypothetical protein
MGGQAWWGMWQQNVRAESKKCYYMSNYQLINQLAPWI